mmetsp:Transcript_11093/g.24717  ORF Transcript_11093/g.24717 Transcript_11093/m.24717 type:complete len:89 (+) Transcript_11093:141-407(+)
MHAEKWRQCAAAVNVLHFKQFLLALPATAHPLQYGRWLSLLQCLHAVSCSDDTSTKSNKRHLALQLPRSNQEAPTGLSSAIPSDACGG